MFWFAIKLKYVIMFGAPESYDYSFWFAINLNLKYVIMDKKHIRDG